MDWMAVIGIAASGSLGVLLNISSTLRDIRRELRKK